MNPTKKLPEFVRPGAVVQAQYSDIIYQGEVGEVTPGGSVYSRKGAYLGSCEDGWTLVTPAPKTLDEKIADLVTLRMGSTRGGALQRYLEDVDKAGLKLVEK